MRDFEKLNVISALIVCAPGKKEPLGGGFWLCYVILCREWSAPEIRM